MRSSFRPARLAALLFLAAVLGAGWALHAGWIAVPARYNPWAELDPAEAPNLLTRIKLERAQRNAGRCMALLESAGARFERVPDRVLGEGCALNNAVRLRGAGDLALSSPALMSCRAALAFALWQRHVLQPAAAEQLGTRISRIDHLGSYACRNVVTGRPPAEGGPGRRSRHATADALDVAAFARADGGHAVVNISRDWAPTTDPAKAGPQAVFLRKVHKGACALFDGVLGPDFNALHADHFHLEVGGWRSCR